MRRLFLSISTSLDGYINDEAGAIDWVTIDDDFNAYVDQMLTSIGGIILGRVAFDELAGFWPEAGPEDVGPTQRRRMHELPKYLLSRSASRLDWHNSHLLGDDPRSAIKELKAEGGGDLALFAGAEAATSLLELGVVDELRLLVEPVLLGGGTRLFEGRYPRRRLQLTQTTRFESGTMLVTYSIVNP